MTILTKFCGKEKLYWEAQLLQIKKILKNDMLSTEEVIGNIFIDLLFSLI